MRLVERIYIIIMKNYFFMFDLMVENVKKKNIYNQNFLKFYIFLNLLVLI